MLPSDSVYSTFKLIDLKDALQYLKDMPTMVLHSQVQMFVSLTEEEMAEYTYPRSFDEAEEQILNNREGRSSQTYKEYNTIVTAMNMIIACARINLAIKALHAKYKNIEIKHGLKNSSLYRDESNISFYKSSEPDVLKIKNLAIKARDRIHNYSKSYTTGDFEKEFVNKLKYKVYAICNVFFVETRTIGQKAEDAGSDFLMKLIMFGLFVLVFFLVAKCATS